MYADGRPTEWMTEDEIAVWEYVRHLEAALRANEADLARAVANSIPTRPRENMVDLPHDLEDAAPEGEQTEAAKPKRSHKKKDQG